MCRATDYPPYEEEGVTPMFKPGQRVRVQTPQGSRFDGLTGTVKEVLPFDGTVMVRTDVFATPLPFGAGELIPVAVRTTFLRDGKAVPR